MQGMKYRESEWWHAEDLLGLGCSILNLRRDRQAQDRKRQVKKRHALLLVGY